MEKELNTRFLRKVLLLFALALSFSSAFAQQQTLKGVVKDEKGETVIGAGVLVKGTTIGSYTDGSGSYLITNITAGQKLTITCLGYLTQEIAFTGQAELNFVLIEDTKLLESVVVIGYGTVRKGDATGAMTTLKTDATKTGFAPNSQDLLIGKVAGVAVTSDGGSPSSKSTIRIRGGSSLSASNDPLIVIDGVMIDNGGIAGVGSLISTINPADIESFTVLKDASATAIYGSRASNGVILITTKKGSEGDMKISYSGNVSISMPKNQVDVLNGDEYRSFVKTKFAGLSNETEAVAKLGTADTDWQKEIFKTAISTDHNISLLGTAKQILPYRVSLGYTDVAGILKTSEMNRYTGSISLSPSLFKDDLKMNFNGRGMFAHNRYADQGAIGAALSMDPTKPVNDPTSPYGGFYTWTGNDGKIIQVATFNPVSLLDMKDDQSDVYNFIGNSQFDYKLRNLPELKFNLNLGIDYSTSDITKVYSELSPADFNNGGYNYSEDQTRNNTALDFYTQYTKPFDFLDSKFDIMGGYSWQRYYLEGYKVGHRISVLDETGNPALISTEKYASEHYLVSFFGRLNYSIQDKYLLTATVRDDGSSRFSDANRWAIFPSVALGWRINQENFLKESEVVSNLKLRIGWGITGQQDINQGDYPYMGTYAHSIGIATNYSRGTNPDGTQIWSTLVRPGAYNPDLKWESTTTYNSGLDYGFFNNRVEGSVDVYYRETTDLINAQTKIAAGTNFAEYVAANIGSLKNRGVEFALNTQPIASKDVQWEIGGNIAYNVNEITSLSFGDNKNSIRRNGTKVNKVGEAANMWYVYEQVYNTDGKPIEGLYKDQNNDGVINEQDLKAHENATPAYTYGLNTKFTYKAWDLSVAGHGSIGNYNYNQIAANGAALSPTSIFTNEFLVNRPMSSFETNFQNNQSLSDYYIQSASFFRIDNINLGWSFKKIRKVPLSGRIFTTVQNPFVFTKYKGLDPEISSGEDNNVYPRPVIVMLGVNLNF